MMIKWFDFADDDHLSMVESEPSDEYRPAIADASTELDSAEDDDFLAPAYLGADEMDESIDDFLAPMVNDSDNASDSVEVDLEEEAAEFAWDPRQGFADDLNIVRVWASDQGELTRVQVSPNWREKLHGLPLARCFAVAFAAMNTYFHLGERHSFDPTADLA